MKKIIPIMLATVFLAVSCSGQSNKSKSKKADKTTATLQLNKTDFLTKVIDFRKNPNEWKYLGDKPALINLYADWCGACKELEPTLEAIATEYKEQIYVYRVNVDKVPEVAVVFGIEALPTTILAPINSELHMALGVIPKPELKEAIDIIMLGKTADNKPE